MPAIARSKRGLTTNTLKIIACVAMLLDHIGFYLIDISVAETYGQFLFLYLTYYILRILGRLAFPIFAFCIALGCRYTHNKLLHFLTVLGLGTVCEVVYYLVEGRLEGNILLTFSCSILIIYTIQFTKWAMARKNESLKILERFHITMSTTALKVLKISLIVLGFLAFFAALGVSYAANHFLGLQYGVFGIAAPAFATLVDYDEGKSPLFLKRLDKHALRLFLFAIGLFIHWWMTGGDLVQMFVFLSLIPLGFYNGRPGSKKFKWGFYIFYPVHLVLIWVIGGLLYGF